MNTRITAGMMVNRPLQQKQVYLTLSVILHSQTEPWIYSNKLIIDKTAATAAGRRATSTGAGRRAPSAGLRRVGAGRATDRLTLSSVKWTSEIPF